MDEHKQDYELCGVCMEAPAIMGGPSNVYDYCSKACCQKDEQ